MEKETPCTSLTTDLPCILREWRDSRNLKMEAAAAMLGVSRSTWGHWEGGTRFPSGSSLLLLKQLTGLSFRELVCKGTPECPHRSCYRE